MCVFYFLCWALPLSVLFGRSMDTGQVIVDVVVGRMREWRAEGGGWQQRGWREHAGLLEVREWLGSVAVFCARAAGGAGWGQYPNHLGHMGRAAA